MLPIYKDASGFGSQPRAKLRMRAGGYFRRPAQGYEAMYAIIQDRGKQYKVSAGDEILIDRRELAKGDAVEFDRVALVSDGRNVEIGAPTVKGALVEGEVIGDEKGKKLTVFFYRRRKDSRRKKGHRQKYLKVRITDIKTE